MIAGSSVGNSATASRVALVLGLGTVALVLGDIPFDALTPHFAGAEAVPFAPFACVGCVVAHRQPRNVIGWLLIGVGLAMGIAYAAGPYAVLAFRDGHPGLPFARIASLLTASWALLLALLLALLPLPILLFPHGRLPSSRWRWPLRGYLVLAAALVFAVAIAGDVPVLCERVVRVDSLGELAKSAGTGSGKGGLPVAALFFLAYAALSCSFIGRQVLGFRRSSGAHREQLKWLLSGAILAVAGAIATVTLSHASAPLVSILGGLGYLAVAALPAAIGVGVLRYRLYEIDSLISRTLSYAILTGLLVGAFVGVVAFTTDVLPLSSRVSVAASTLVAAALFNPLRSSVQRLVDRRFNRARYDADATVAAFTARLRDAVEIDAIRDDLLEAVSRSVEPAHASVWIRP